MHVRCLTVHLTLMTTGGRFWREPGSQPRPIYNWYCNEKKTLRKMYLFKLAPLLALQYQVQQCRSGLSDPHTRKSSHSLVKGAIFAIGISSVRQINPSQLDPVRMGHPLLPKTGFCWRWLWLPPLGVLSPRPDQWNVHLSANWYSGTWVLYVIGPISQMFPR